MGRGLALLDDRVPLDARLNGRRAELARSHRSLLAFRLGMVNDQLLRGDLHADEWADCRWGVYESVERQLRRRWLAELAFSAWAAMAPFDPSD